MFNVLSTLRHNGVEYPKNSQIEDSEMTEEQCASLLEAGVIALVVAAEPKRVSKVQPVKTSKKAVKEAPVAEEKVELNEAETEGQGSEITEEDKQDTEKETETTGEESEAPSLNMSKAQLMEIAKAQGVEVSEIDSKTTIMSKLK